jgi:ABC-type Na+ efflux pump permease subunit
MNVEPASMTERVGISPARIWIIALNTFTEAVRQKVFNFLLIFALVAIASASFFAQFSFSEQLKFVKDFCLGAMSVFGTLIAIVGTAQLLPSEVENRTIYTILAKPVRRFEFLLGKYLGGVLLILMSVAMMSLLFGAALTFKQNRLVVEARQESQTTTGASVQEVVNQIQAEAFDPDLVKGVLLVFVKLGLLAAITMLFSTFSTSMVFNVAMALMVFFAGHLRGPAMEMWGQHKLVMYLLAIIPDLGAFNVADDIILGNKIPWRHVGEVALVGLGRTGIIVVAAHLIFSRREI